MHRHHLKLQSDNIIDSTIKSLTRKLYVLDIIVILLLHVQANVVIRIVNAAPCKCELLTSISLPTQIFKGVHKYQVRLVSQPIILCCGILYIYNHKEGVYVSLLGPPPTTTKMTPMVLPCLLEVKPPGATLFEGHLK